MPLIGKNADYFLRSTGPEVRTKRPGRGRAASSSMELFNGVWGLRHQQAECPPCRWQGGHSCKKGPFLPCLLVLCLVVSLVPNSPLDFEEKYLFLFIRQIFHNVLHRAVKNFAQCVQCVGGHGITSFQTAYGGTADAAFDLKRIGGRAAPFHCSP